MIVDTTTINVLVTGAFTLGGVVLTAGFGLFSAWIASFNERARTAAAANAVERQELGSARRAAYVQLLIAINTHQNETAVIATRIGAGILSLPKSVSERDTFLVTHFASIPTLGEAEAQALVVASSDVAQQIKNVGEVLMAAAVDVLHRGELGPERVKTTRSAINALEASMRSDVTAT